MQNRIPELGARTRIRKISETKDRSDYSDSKRGKKTEEPDTKSAVEQAVYRAATVNMKTRKPRIRKHEVILERERKFNPIDSNEQ